MPSNVEDTGKVEVTQTEAVVPPLTKRQRQDAEDRTSVSVIVVHEAIRFDGEVEL